MICVPKEKIGGLNFTVANLNNHSRRILTKKKAIDYQWQTKHIFYWEVSLLFTNNIYLKLTYSNTLATSCEELTHWKRPWCWEGLGAGGEGDDRGWDGWMASPPWWAWVWVNSGSWWWQGDLACCDSWGHKESDRTERLNWTEN